MVSKTLPKSKENSEKSCNGSNTYSELLKSNQLADLIYKYPPSEDVKVTLSKISPKDSSWDGTRANTMTLEGLYGLEPEFERYSERLHHCSFMLYFGKNEKGLILKRASFCRVRYCPVCQSRKSAFWRAMMLNNIDQLRADYPTHRWLFLTISSKNPHITDLRAELKHLNKSWQRLSQRKAFKSVVDGWIRTTEVTRGKDKPMNANPHFHVMLMVKPSYFRGQNYINQAQWQEMWRSCLQVDYAPNVDIRVVSNRSKKKTQEDGLRIGILETLKYSVKASDILGDGSAKSNEWLYELTRQTHKMRFVATGGILKNIFKKDEDITNNDLVTLGESEEENATDEKRWAFLFDRSDKKYNYAPSYNE